MKSILAVWAVGALLTLAFWAGIIYVILHFVQKWW